MDYVNRFSPSKTAVQVDLLKLIRSALRDVSGRRGEYLDRHCGGSSSKVAQRHHHSKNVGNTRKTHVSQAKEVLLFASHGSERRDDDKIHH